MKSRSRTPPQWVTSCPAFYTLEIKAYFSFGQLLYICHGKLHRIPFINIHHIQHPILLHRNHHPSLLTFTLGEATARRFWALWCQMSFSKEGLCSCLFIKVQNFAKRFINSFVIRGFQYPDETNYKYKKGQSKNSKSPDCLFTHDPLITWSLLSLSIGSFPVPSLIISGSFSALSVMSPSLFSVWDSGMLLNMF